MAQRLKRTYPYLAVTALVSSALAGSACSAAPKSAPLPEAAPAATVEVPVEQAETAHPIFDVVYRQSWFGAVRLLGIDEQNHRAFLRLESQEPSRLLVDTIDLKTGRRTGTWEATPSNAEAAGAAKFAPMTGDFATDLTRYAELLHAAGPWHLRGGSTTPQVTVTQDKRYILYGAPADDGTDGDWLYVTDAEGKRPRRIDGGLIASYAPVFSPDGDWVAWQGCDSSPCEYGLYLTQLGGKPDRVSKVSNVSAPVWSKDGHSLYVVGRQGGTSCLFRVPRRKTWEVARLACVEGLNETGFLQDAEGRTGVIYGTRGEPGSQVGEAHWVLLEDGEVLATYDVPGASGTGILSASGMMALPVQRGGMAIVDLITGQHGLIEGGTSWFFGIERSKWFGDSLIVLRKAAHGRAFEVVEIDARRVLAHDEVAAGEGAPTRTLTAPEMPAPEMPAAEMSAPEMSMPMPESPQPLGWLGRQEAE